MKLNWVRLAALSAAVLFAGGLLAPHAEARQNASATEINRSVSEALAKHGLLRPAGAPATDATVAPGGAADLGPADADQVDKLANGVAQSLKKVQANVSQTLRTDKFRLRVMPRGGSFGGGGRSFGGGGGFGGGGFGGGRPSSGFGGGTGSFGRPSSGFGGGSTTSPRTAPGMSSFGRSGSMGSNNPIRSSSVRPSYASGWGAPTRNYYIGGYPAYGGWWTGYSYGWLHPAWYYYTPFWPSFYYGPPTMYGGVYYPGEFQWGKLILGLIIIGFIIWLLGKLFGGGKGVRYTTYR